MTHTDLITEVTRQLAGRFQPQPAMVKKRVESLIEVRRPLFLFLLWAADVFVAYVPLCDAPPIMIRAACFDCQREYLDRGADRKSYTYLA
jgi:Cullin protein neddylation domain